jgi:hypothetical protein
MNVTPFPDPQAMAAHLNHVFGDARDGLIEVAYTDPGGPAPETARLFDAGDIDAAATFAAERNAERRNLYIGAALRRLDAPRFKRTRMEHFHAAPAAWCDIDNGEHARLAQSVWQEREEPTLCIVTGRHPDLRLQLYWRLLEPIACQATTKGLNEQLQVAFGADDAVLHASALMRLGGSVAWPVKPGRVPELTEVHGAPDLCPIPTPVGALRTAYPPPKRPERPPKPLPKAPGHHPRYVEKAVENGLTRIAHAAEGERNNALNREAFSLLRFVADGTLPEQFVVDGLLAAALHAGLDQKEAERTIASARRGREAAHAA